MNPTLHDQEIVIYQRNADEYRAGDVIVFSRPDGREFVKRIIAVAGDTVNLSEGKVYVNGREYRIPGIEGVTERIAGNIENPYRVSDHHVYVLGDNRENSEDSRSFGAVDLSDVRGKIKWYMGKL